MSSSRRVRTVLALAVNNWPSRCYLAVVVLATAAAVYDDLFVSHADASMAYVAPMLLTAPFIFLWVLLPAWMTAGAFFYVGIALGAVVNAIVLGTLARAFRQRPRSSAPMPNL